MTPIEPQQDDFKRLQQEAEISQRLSDGLRALAPDYAEEVRKLKRNARLRRTGRQASLPLALSLTALLLWGLQTRDLCARRSEWPSRRDQPVGRIAHLGRCRRRGRTVRYPPWPRQATLTKGTALFEIRHIAVAPFTMRAGQATITDLGTRFLVRLSRGGSASRLRRERWAFPPRQPARP